MHNVVDIGSILTPNAISGLGARAVRAHRGVRIEEGSGGEGSTLNFSASLGGLAAGTSVTFVITVGCSTAAPQNVGCVCALAGAKQTNLHKQELDDPTKVCFYVDCDVTEDNPRAEVCLFLADAGQLANQTFEFYLEQFLITSGNDLSELRNAVLARQLARPRTENDLVANPNGQSLRQALHAAGRGSAHRYRRVLVEPGRYESEIDPDLSDVPPEYCEIQGLGHEHEQIIDTRVAPYTPNSPQFLQVQESIRIASLTVLAENVRHALHVEAGNHRRFASQVFEDCTLVNFGAARDGWAAATAFGIGLHEGNHQTYRRCTAISRDAPTGGLAFGFHNNADWETGATVEAFDCAFIAPDNDGLAISAASAGAGVMSTATFRNCSIAGHVVMDVGQWMSARCNTNRANRFEFKLHFDNCTPFEWTAPCPTECLALTGSPGDQSFVSVAGDAGVLLFGMPMWHRGGRAFPAHVYSMGAVSMVGGDIVRAPVTLAERLGDLSGHQMQIHLQLSEGEEISITLEENFTELSNAEIVSILNSKLAEKTQLIEGAGFSIASGAYENRAPLFQNDRERWCRNAGEAVVEKGHALAWEGRNIKLMTAGDPPDKFAGIALDDAIPGEPCRFQHRGWINESHLWRSQSALRPVLDVGDRLEVGPQPGVLTVGSSRAVISVRSVDHWNACLAFSRD